MVKQRIIACLEQIGVLLEDEPPDTMALGQFFEDSVSFIQFIVALEEEFQLELPDEYLDIHRIGTFEALSASIDQLMKA